MVKPFIETLAMLPKAQVRDGNFAFVTHAVADRAAGRGMAGALKLEPEPVMHSAIVPTHGGRPANFLR